VLGDFERAGLLQRLLSERLDLTQEEKRQAMARFLRGEPIGITLPGREPEGEGPSLARKAADFTLGALAPPGLAPLLNPEVQRRAMASLPSLGELAQTTTTIFPALTVAMDELTKTPSVQEGQRVTAEERERRLAEGLAGLSPFAALTQPEPLTMTELPTKETGEALKRGSSALVAGLEETGFRALKGGTGLLGAMVGEDPVAAEAQGRAAWEARRKEAQELSRSLGLLGPEDVTERKAAQVLYPEEGVGQEVATEIYSLIDPDAAGALASLAVKGGLFAAARALKGSRAVRRQLLGEAANEASEFAQATLRASKESIDPSHVAAWVDALEDTAFVKKGGNPDVLAAYVEKHGLEKTVERGLFKLSPEEGLTLKAALGDAVPSDFGTRIQRLERAQAREREQLVELVSTNDLDSEVMLASTRQKAATIVGRELSTAQKEALKQRGLTVATINVADLPKGQDRVRLIYDSELVGAIQEGLRSSPIPGLRSLAEFGKTPDEFVRTLARKNPRQLTVLSAGGLQSDYAGLAGVKLTIGGQEVASRTVNGADLVPTARALLDQAKAARGAAARTAAQGAGDLGRALPGASLADEEAFLVRSQVGKLGIRFEGQPIEQLAAISGLTTDHLRMVQTRLADLGLTHLEATTLAGTLSGHADELARKSILIEAARTVRAAKPRKFPTVQDAAQALRQTLDEISAELPERARFFRFEGQQVPAPVVLRQRMLKGEVYYDPVERRYRPVQPDIPPPGYAVRDPAKAGQPVEVKGIPLHTVSPAEAENLVRHGHKHPAVPAETPAGTIARKLTGQSEETVNAQVRAAEDTAVARFRAEVGEAVSLEATREFLFGPDPQAVLRAELRRVGIDAVQPTGVAPGQHGAAIQAMQEQAFELRKALRAEYEANPMVRAKLAADELHALENGRLEAAVELGDVQGRRMQLSERLQGLDRDMWDALGRRDDAAIDALQAQMDAIAPEMMALRQKALELDGAITQAEKQALERAGRAQQELGLDEVTALAARSSSSPEMARYAIGEETYVAAARINEGKTEAIARAEFRLSQDPGWSVAIPPEAPIGPNSPRMHEAAWGGDAMDSGELLRMDKELSGVTRWKAIARSLRSPLNSIPRSLGMRQELATRTIVNVESKLRFAERSMQQGVLRRRLLSDPTDRFLAGRLLENDAAAIPRQWLDEVLDGQTPRAQAVKKYTAMIQDATKRVADHAQVPVFRRLRDYFAHYKLHNSAGVRKLIASQITEARKAGDAAVVKTLEREMDLWAKSEVRYLNAYDQDWIPDSMLRYGPLEERLDKVFDYVKDPEKMLGMAEAQAARYRFLKDTLPHWNRAIERAGGRLTETGVIKSERFANVIDRLVEGRRALWEPPGAMNTAFRRLVAETMQRPFGRPVAKLIDSHLLDQVSHFARRVGFMMHIGGRASTALVNLTTIPLHTALRMRPKDTPRGLAAFLYDQGMSGQAMRNIPGMQGFFADAGAIYGRGLSHVRPLYDEAVAGINIHWWELGEGDLDPGLLRRMVKGAEEAAFEAAGVMFRSTEGVNRGATFYAQALRGFDALEEFRTTGKISSAFYDGWIAPTERDLISDWKTLRARIPEMERAVAAGGDVGPGMLDEASLARLKALEASDAGDLDKAKAWFDPERGIREALASDDPTRWIKDRAVAAMQETQGTYNRMNRPVFIQEYAPWAESATQFLDFSRHQIEMFAQRLSFGQKLAFLGMLYAIGGPRALPMIEWAIDTVGFVAPKTGEDWERALIDFETKDGVWAGAGPAAGVDVAGRLKPNLPFSGLTAGKSDQTIGQRIMAVLGGPPVAPFVEIHAGVSEAAEQARYMAERLGVPVTEAAQAQAQAPRAELRQEVKSSDVGRWGVSGAAMAHPGAQAVANLPGKGLVSLAQLFEDAGASGMASYAGVLGESIQFRPSARENYVELPGDRILATSGMMRDLVRGSRLAEGATVRRGRVGTITQRGNELAQAIGLTPTEDVAERILVRSMSRKAEVADKARQGAIASMIEHGTPRSREEGRRATPTEIADHMTAQSWEGVTPAVVRGQVFARSNPLIGRFAASLSTQAKRDLYQLEGLREKLIEAYDTARETGNEQSAAAVMATFLKTRRSFYGAQIEDVMRSRDPQKARALQASLAADLREVPDPEPQAELFKAFSTGTYQGQLDKDMMVLQRIADTGDEQALERFARVTLKGKPRDEVERQQLYLIGLFLMELRQSPSLTTAGR